MKLTMVLAAAGLGAALMAVEAPAQDQFDVEKAAEQCAACHGEKGVPIEPDYPIIWGQEFYYLYVQLRDYEAGRRTNEIMQPIAAQFTRGQMKALAQHFSEKGWPEIPVKRDAEKAKAGRSVAASGQCPQCHNTYMGDSRVPRVAGQQEAYLERTMLEFKNKVRQNAPSKTSLMKSFDDASLDQIAHFLATR